MASKTKGNKKTHNKTSKKKGSKVHEWAHKRPWKITYRSKNGEKTIKILKNGAEKNAFLKKIEKYSLHIYGVNNLTDNQIEFYKRKGLL
jgi:hypothetical protein